MKELTIRGHDVHLVARSRHNARLAALIDQSGAKVHFSPWKVKEPVTKLVVPFTKWIQALAPDVYVISGSAAIGWLTLPHLPDHLPTYMIGHNDEKTYYVPVEHYHSFLTGTIGVSNQICNTYVNNCNVPEGKVTWIPYGVIAANSIVRTTHNKSIRIVYVGRIERHQKRILDLVAVINELCQRGISFSCDIVGDGPDMPLFKENLKLTESNGAVTFHGWLEKPDVQAILQNADIFLMTSAFEGFSIALTEGMANGCCPIVTDIKAGNQQLIENGRNGYLLQVGDIGGFVKKIELLVSDTQKLNQLRNEAWITGKQYSLAHMAEKYETLFLNGLAEKKNKRALSDPSFPILSTCYSKYPMWLRRIKAKITSVPAV
jgi:glycosyltransferase involved in cell wall biosynthesis